MPHARGVPWPPDPIDTDRLILRCTQESDRPGYLELLCNDEAHRYLGGPADRAEVEAAMPAVPGQRPGVFAVEAAGAFVGAVTLEPHDSDGRRPVTLPENAMEISYIFHPDVLLVLVTQVANLASLRLARRSGFTEVARFVEHGSEQWCGVRS